MTYRALVDLTYPATPAFDAELRAAAELPDAERQDAVARVALAGGFKRAAAGALVSDLPALSLPWLLEQALIEPVATPGPTAAPTPAPIASAPVAAPLEPAAEAPKPTTSEVKKVKDDGV